LEAWTAIPKEPTLLKAIDNSSIDGDSESRFEIHTIDLSHNGEEAADVTYTNEAEFAEFARQPVNLA